MSTGEPTVSRRDVVAPEQTAEPDGSSGDGRRSVRPQVAGGVVAVTIAAIIYSQFNLYGHLGRDSAIYVYGGQRFTHGVPPYASIMDPKGPLPSILCGFGVAVARLFGRNDIYVIRAEFCALSIFAALGIYLLVLELWHSVVAGVVAAAVFASFKMFAYDALSGPDGHTPGIVFVIFALWLTVRRQWYLAGVAASLAFFSWQPLFAYPAVVLLCAAVWSRGHRRRAIARNVAGGATPFVVLAVFFAATGYPGKFFEGTFIFPLVGVYRPPASISDRLRWIFRDIPRSYGPDVVLLWAGLILLVVIAVCAVVSARSEWRAAATSPLILLIMLSLVLQVAYVLYDYIGWTHSFPLLPYAALGIGGSTAYLLRAVRRFSWPYAHPAAGVAMLAAVVALTAVSAVAYYQPSDNSMLRGEVASACALQQSMVPGTRLWSIDNPIPLVLLHRENPDNYPYVGSGLAGWRVSHTPGGFRAWMRQIKATSSVVTLDYWRPAPLRNPVMRWLRSHGYKRGFIGTWQVYVTPKARAHMRAHSIALSKKRHTWPLTPDGQLFHAGAHCSALPAG
jgi:hypothetical protein